jgi:hypothetical protein
VIFLRIPVLAWFLNQVVGRFWPFTHLGLIQLVIASARGTARRP